MLVVQYESDAAVIPCPHRGEVLSAAPNISIVNSSGSTVLASTAATKGTFSSTPSSTVSVGDKQITLTAVTNLFTTHKIGDHEDIALTEHGAAETARVIRVDTTNKIAYLKDRIQRGFSTSATAKSLSLYYSADISDTDDFPKGIYSAIFTNAAWEIPRIVMFRVADIGNPNPVTFQHMRRWCAFIAEIRDGNDTADLKADRDSAWRLIKAKMRRAGRDPEAFREGEDGEDPQNESVADAGGILAAAIFCAAHGQSEYAFNLAGNPIGEGGIFANYWGDIVEAPHWFDEDQDRAVDKYEMRKVTTVTLKRGL